MKRHRALAGALWCLAGACHADEPGPSRGAPGDWAPEAARGRISLGFQALHTDGLITDAGINNRGAITDTRSLTLSVEYRWSEHWTVFGSVPYITKRSRRDLGLHDPRRLDNPRTDSRFLDDGRYHGAWQDFQLGVVRHLRVGALRVDPYAVLTVPSHDYTFFANAAVGSRLHRLLVGVDVGRRLGSGNLHGSIGYGYELVEEVLGMHLDKHHARASLGYHFSPRVTGQIFVQLRRSHGLDSSDTGTDRRSELWYQHDRMFRHDYSIAGVNAAWQINSDWSVSLGHARMVWGRSVHELTGAWDLQLSRAF